MNYQIKQFPEKKFTEKMDMIRFMKKNHEELIYLKKLEYKINVSFQNNVLKVTEYNPVINVNSDIIRVKAVINTTNIIDSHQDLHMAKIWNKTVSDKPTTYQLQEHIQSFTHILSGKAKQYNEQMNFKDLGLNRDFDTIANINDFVLHREKNPLMFDAYANGEVKEHSVGMYYVNLNLAIYDEEDDKERNYFEEMKDFAVNPEVADLYGYFWVVAEAKKMEGSAVLFGSNSVTPTLSVEDYEPSNDTQEEEIDTIEPSNDTQDKKKELMFNDFIY